MTLTPIKKLSLMLSILCLISSPALTADNSRKNSELIAAHIRVGLISAISGYLANKNVRHWLPANALGLSLAYSANRLFGGIDGKQHDSAICGYVLGALLGNAYK